MALNMSPAPAPQQQSALQTFMNTPQFALAYGANGVANNAALTPQQRFQADPGYQYSVNQALNQVKASFGSQGLLNSGAALQAATTTAQGLAQQQYNQWQTNQNNMYNQYMGNLAGVMNNGANQYASGLSQQYGENLASLYANQGTAGLGAYSNTGAAQAGLINNAADVLAQLQQAQFAAQNSQVASSAGAAFGALGAQAAGRMAGIGGGGGGSGGGGTNDWGTQIGAPSDFNNTGTTGGAIVYPSSTGTATGSLPTFNNSPISNANTIQQAGQYTPTSGLDSQNSAMQAQAWALQNPGVSDANNPYLNGTMSATPPPLPNFSQYAQNYATANGALPTNQQLGSQYLPLSSSSPLSSYTPSLSYQSPFLSNTQLGAQYLPVS